MADQIEQYLEEGWTHLESGDLTRARAAADAALALDAEEAAVHTLLGAIAGGEGDAAGMLEALERAMDLDPDAYDPVILAVDALAAVGDVDAALEMCERALDLADEEDEYLDALLLKAEIEIAADDEEAAKKTLADLPPADVALPDATMLLRAGDALRLTGQLDEAEARYRVARETDGLAADALHGLALCAESRDDRPRMIELFQEVRKLDLGTPPKWTVTEAELEKQVEAALAELPAEARTLLGNVPILLEDYPSEAVVADGTDPRSLGLFAGLPFPEHGGAAAPHLEQILIYRLNVARDCHSLDEVADEIRTTLLHETGHFFGLDEEDLANMGLD
jgi:predicted Zn-dependent protease with MMP-like domain